VEANILYKDRKHLAKKDSRRITAEGQKEMNNIAQNLNKWLMVICILKMKFLSKLNFKFKFRGVLSLWLIPLRVSDGLFQPDSVAKEWIFNLIL